MTRLLAAIATDPEHMPTLLAALDAKQAPGAAGTPDDVWGLGYYQDTHALTSRKPAYLLPIRSIFDFARGVRTRILLGAAGPSSGQPIESEMPWRFRHWLCVTSGDFNAIRGDLVDRFPGYIRSEFEGARGSQLAFAVILRELHDRGVLADPLAEARPVAEAFRRGMSVSRMLAREGGTELNGSVVLSNGRVLLAWTAGASIAYRRQEGLELPTGTDLGFGTLDPWSLASSLKNFRAVVLETGFVANDARGFKKLESGMLWVDRRMTIELANDGD